MTSLTDIGHKYMDANQPVDYFLVENNRWTRFEAEVITETPVSLTVNGEIWLTFMCTPVDLEAMAIGFLYNEGVIGAMDEVASTRLCPAQDNVDVWLHHSVEKPEKWRRTSGCTGGVTAVENLLDRPQTALQPDGNTVLTAGQVSNLIEMLFDSQDLYRKSGGVHTSALSDGQQLYVIGEDIGRHNTLDKLAGRCLMDEIEMPRRIVLTTGRISSEMMQKSARLGASIVISRTSPSSLSVQLAQRWGITLIGYARRNRFRVYSHPERCLLSQENQS